MQNIQKTISKLAEDYIDGMLDESGMTEAEFYKTQAEFYKSNESHICDCFTDTYYLVKKIEGSEENELQSKVESEIVKIIMQRSERRFTIEFKDYDVWIEVDNGETFSDSEADVRMEELKEQYPLTKFRFVEVK